VGNDLDITVTADAPELAVRAGRDDDIAAVTRIYAQAVRTGTGTFDITPPDEAGMRTRLGAVRARGLPWLVAERAGRIVGFCYAAPYKLREAYAFTVESSIYVDEGARRCGIGRALLGALIEACAAAGLRQMVAVVGDSENAASIGLHRALGFEKAGCFRNVGFKHGRWLDIVLMQRPLGPGGDAPPHPASGDTTKTE